MYTPRPSHSVSKGRGGNDRDDSPLSAEKSSSSDHQLISAQLPPVVTFQPQQEEYSSFGSVRGRCHRTVRETRTCSVSLSSK
ncbi:hypothetical protein TNIN_318931 [Trichonephila inaurata madagascariensis]|uniref:Uncharacterized protein n=1 Tax=Trichonephila inaurata madagascariensis TaxID=2747483 RepID=A0A8X6YZU7_9ARAC|nr:hypothetical protein TNIN_318931 [Trichonephila inaurata madagascariensis]